MCQQKLRMSGWVRKEKGGVRQRRREPYSFKKFFLCVRTVSAFCACNIPFCHLFLRVKGIKFSLYISYTVE